MALYSSNFKMSGSPFYVPPQYAILLTMVLTTFIKYLLHTIDLQSENPWDNKAVYMLYTELFTGTVFSILNIYCTYTSGQCVCNLSWNTQILVFIPGFIKVLLYIAFMTIMIKVHTFPLFAIRPMYLAMRWAAVCLCVFLNDEVLLCICYFHNFSFCFCKSEFSHKSNCS